MASTTFVDGETLIEASWLNDVNAAVYTPGTQTAADIANVPAGSITATDVQAALNELDTEKQPINADLTAIAALTTAAYGRSLLTTTDEANFKATVNLEIGTDVQAYNANIPTAAPGTSGNLLASNGTTWASVADKAIGVGQTWTDVKTTPGRAKGTTYTNSSGRPLQVMITQADGAGGVGFQIGGVTIAAAGSGATTSNHVISAIVPTGVSYGLTNTGGAVAYWYELI